MKRYELSLTVLPEDIDGLGHVNNVVYLRWMQQAAGAHWAAAAPPELRATVSWVVIRHEIDYRAPAFEGETLVVGTWVGAATAATWERFCEVRRVVDGKLLAQGRTVYVALDPVSGRPRRLDATLLAPLGGV